MNTVDDHRPKEAALLMLSDFLFVVVAGAFGAAGAPLISFVGVPILRMLW